MPLQLEYYSQLFERDTTRNFIKGGVAAWDYADNHIPTWHNMGVEYSHVSYVSVRCHYKQGMAHAVLRTGRGSSSYRRFESACPPVLCMR